MQKTRHTHEHKGQQGVAIVEMAIFMLVFSFVIVALFDFGAIISSSVELSNAARIGGRVAMAQYANTSGITYAIQNGSTLPSNQVTVSTSNSCECNDVSASCNSACVGTMATFVTITTSYNVPLLLSYPGLSNPYPLSKTLIVRGQ